MRMYCKTARNGEYRNESNFFNENSEFEKIAIKMAFREKGTDGIKDYLTNNENFKGTIKNVCEDTVDKIVYVLFTVPHTYKEERYDIKTGEYVGEEEVTENVGYVMVLVDGTEKK